MNQSPLVTVVIPTYNRCESLRLCLDSLVSQQYKNFEVLVCDDASTDSTVSMCRQYASVLPLRVIESDRQNRGPSYARNAGIRSANGEIIFFTDDDVTVTKDWITNGLPFFDDDDCVGVEGRIVYVSEDYRPSISDRQVANFYGGLYMTANAAYRRDALFRAGMFDLSLRKYQDRDIALRTMRFGIIKFAPQCVVYHQREKYTYRSFMGEAKKMKWWAELCSKHPDTIRSIENLTLNHAANTRSIDRLSSKKAPSRRSISDLIYRPDRWAVILFPPALLLRCFQVRISSGQDLLLLLLTYPRLLLERYYLWRSAIRNRVLLI